MRKSRQTAHENYHQQDRKHSESVRNGNSNARGEATVSVRGEDYK